MPPTREQFQREMINYDHPQLSVLPWRETDSDFHALAAVVMLQRTSREQAVPVYQAFVDRFETPDDVLAVPDEELQHLLEPLGLQNRAAYIRNIATFLQSGQAMTQDNLLAVNGLGRYSVNAFLSIYRQEPLPIVDVNVQRVFGHYGFDTEDCWTTAERLLPDDTSVLPAYQMGLLDYGAALR